MSLGCRAEASSSAVAPRKVHMLRSASGVTSTRQLPVWPCSARVWLRLLATRLCSRSAA